MDCLDNERRPHFPQFSYSASGREWTVRHHSDIITAGHRRDPQLLDRPRMTLTWRISPLLLSSSPLHLSSPLLFFSFVKASKQSRFWACAAALGDPKCSAILCAVMWSPFEGREQRWWPAVFWHVLILPNTEKQPLIDLDDSRDADIAASYLWVKDAAF